MCVHVGLWGTFIFGVSMNILFAFASSLIVLKYVYMCRIFYGDIWSGVDVFSVIK